MRRGDGKVMTDATIRGDIHGVAAAMTINGRGCAAAPRTREKHGSLDRVLVFQSKAKQTRADQADRSAIACRGVMNSCWDDRKGVFCQLIYYCAFRSPKRLFLGCGYPADVPASTQPVARRCVYVSITALKNMS